jgi:hypothetical protein
VRLTQHAVKEFEQWYEDRRYTVPQWLNFGTFFLALGYVVHVHQAKTTVSRYVTVCAGPQQFRVRFSDHRPARVRQEAGDCDFYVGHSHGEVTTTSEAIRATLKFFKQSVSVEAANEDHSVVDSA